MKGTTVSLRTRVLVSVSLVVLLVVAGVFVAKARTSFLQAKQVGNCGLLQFYVGLIDEYRQVNGTYPLHLAEAVALASAKVRKDPKFLRLLDNWGNPLMYKSDGSHYLLVSYGRDGKPDGTDYRTVSESDEKACTDLNADAFATESGIHRCCGK